MVAVALSHFFILYGGSQLIRPVFNNMGADRIDKVNPQCL